MIETDLSRLVVVESPLGSDDPEIVARNKRFVEWCCRAVFIVDGREAIASHLVCPHFLDDKNPQERAAGIGWSWFWIESVPHWFFIDLGFSTGMMKAIDKCRREGFPVRTLELERYHHESWIMFCNGLRSPHTEGF